MLCKSPFSIGRLLCCLLLLIHSTTSTTIHGRSGPFTANTPHLAPLPQARQIHFIELARFLVGSPVLEACPIPKGNEIASGVLAQPQANGTFWEVSGNNEPILLTPGTGLTTDCATNRFVPPGGTLPRESVAFAPQNGGPCVVYSFQPASPFPPPLTQTLQWACGEDVRAIAFLHLPGYTLFVTAQWRQEGGIIRWWQQQDGDDALVEIGSYDDVALPHRVAILDPQDGWAPTILVADLHEETGGVVQITLDLAHLNKRAAMQRAGLPPPPVPKGAVLSIHNTPLPGARGLAVLGELLFVNNHDQPHISVFRLPNMVYLHTTVISNVTDTWGFALCDGRDTLAAISGNPGGNAAIYRVNPISGTLAFEMALPAPLAPGISVDVDDEDLCRFLFASLAGGNDPSPFYQQVAAGSASTSSSASPSASPSHSNKASPSLAMTQSHSPSATHSAPETPSKSHSRSEPPSMTRSPERTNTASASSSQSTSPARTHSPSAPLYTPPPTSSPSRSPVRTPSQSSSQPLSASQSTSRSESPSQSLPLPDREVTICFNTSGLHAPFPEAQLNVTLTTQKGYNQTRTIPWDNEAFPAFKDVSISRHAQFTWKNITDTKGRAHVFILDPAEFAPLEENQLVTVVMLPVDENKQPIPYFAIFVTAVGILFVGLGTAWHIYVIHRAYRRPHTLLFWWLCLPFGKDSAWQDGMTAHDWLILLRDGSWNFAGGIMLSFAALKISQQVHTLGTDAADKSLSVPLRITCFFIMLTCGCLMAYWFHQYEKTKTDWYRHLALATSFFLFGYYAEWIVDTWNWEDALFLDDPESFSVLMVLAFATVLISLSDGSGFLFFMLTYTLPAIEVFSLIMGIFDFVIIPGKVWHNKEADPRWIGWLIVTLCSTAAIYLYHHVDNSNRLEKVAHYKKVRPPDHRPASPAIFRKIASPFWWPKGIDYTQGVIIVTVLLHYIQQSRSIHESSENESLTATQAAAWIVLAFVIGGGRAYFFDKLTPWWFIGLARATTFYLVAKDFDWLLRLADDNDGTQAFMHRPHPLFVVVVLSLLMGLTALRKADLYHPSYLLGWFEELLSCLTPLAGAVALVITLEEAFETSLWEDEISFCLANAIGILGGIVQFWENYSKVNAPLEDSPIMMSTTSPSPVEEDHNEQYERHANELRERINATDSLHDSLQRGESEGAGVPGFSWRKKLTQAFKPLFISFVAFDFARWWLVSPTLEDIADGHYLDNMSTYVFWALACIGIAYVTYTIQDNLAYRALNNAAFVYVVCQHCTWGGVAHANTSAQFMTNKTSFAIAIVSCLIAGLSAIDPICMELYREFGKYTFISRFLFKGVEFAFKFFSPFARPWVLFGYLNYCTNFFWNSEPWKGKLWFWLATAFCGLTLLYSTYRALKIWKANPENRHARSASKPERRVRFNSNTQVKTINQGDSTGHDAATYSTWAY